MLGWGTAILLSCSRSPVQFRLDAIESLAASNPDSALSALRQLDTTTLLRPAAKAQYALLLAMTLDKTCVDTTDDRILSPAMSYYEKNGTPRQKMLAHYYMGRIQFNAGRYPEAMVSMEKAQERVRRVGESRYSGLIQLAMADILSRCFCFEEEAGHLREARTAFARISDSTCLLLVDEKRALNAYNRGYIKESLGLLDSLINLRDLPSFIQASALSNRAYIKADTTTVDFSGALSDYLAGLSAGESLSPRKMSSYAYVLSRCGYEREATQIFQMLKEDGEEAENISALFQIPLFVEAGDYRSAFSMLKDNLDYEDRFVKQMAEQSVFKAQRDYFHARESLFLSEKERKEQALWMVLLISFLVILAIGGVSFSLWNRWRNKKMKMERLADSLGHSLSSLREEGARKDDQIQTLQKQYENIFMLQFRQMEEYYLDFERARRSGAGEKELFQRLLGLIHEIEGNVAGQSRFEDLLNERIPGIMKRLDACCPNLNDKDRRLFAYTVAEFDRTTICMLLGNISVDALNMRRSRLRKVFHSLSDSEERTLFENSLSISRSKSST